MNISRKKIKQGARGGVALITVVVVSFVVLTMALAISLAGLGELRMGFGEGQSAISYRVAEACLEEAGLRLKKDPSYAGGSLSVGDKSCTIGVATNGSQRTVTATATVNNFTRKIELVANVVSGGLSVTSWREVTN